MYVWEGRGNQVWESDTHRCIAMVGVLEQLTSGGETMESLFLADCSRGLEPWQLPTGRRESAVIETGGGGRGRGREERERGRKGERKREEKGRGGIEGGKERERRKGEERERGEGSARERRGCCSREKVSDLCTFHKCILSLRVVPFQ